MTREYFLRLCTNEDGTTYVDTEDFIKFFDSNVCIPKGENRHPYANSLHEWLEDTTMILEFHDGYCIKVNQ